MKPTRTKPATGKERGVAAIELALILAFVGIVLLPTFLWVGRLLWHYTVAEKAAHDAARYLSTVPVADMKSLNRSGTAVGIAMEVGNAETAELNLGDGLPVYTITCGKFTCGGQGAPTTVRVAVQFPMSDPVFQLFTQDDGIWITADVTLPYVGD